MEIKGNLIIHLSDNGKLPLISDIKDYNSSWNHQLILFGNCLKVKKGILEGAYKTIDINIHIEKADEVAYNDTTIEKEIHLNDINFIGNRSGKILTTIECRGQLIDFICDSIIRMKEYSLFFRNPILTEYELLWSEEQKLRFERENEAYRYLSSKSISIDWHGQYLGKFLPFDSIKIIQIEPYIEEDDSEEGSGTVEYINLVVSTLDKSIDFHAQDWRKTCMAEKNFRSISRLNHFMKDLESRGEYELCLIDSNTRQPQYLLKGKDGKCINLDDLRNLGIYFKVYLHDRGSYEDDIDWRNKLTGYDDRNCK